MDKKYARYLLDKIQIDYDLTAKEFSKNRSNPWKEIEFLFNSYSENGDRVLDLGCGNGRFYEFLKNKNINYVGIDISQKLIELAKRKYPGAKFQIGDALHLSFPDGFFDKIFSIAVLHHIPSENLRLRFLKEIKRTMKQDGFLILTVWKFHNKKDILLLLKYTILKIIGNSEMDFNDIFKKWGRKTKKYYHWFSEKELINLVKKVGFKVKKSGIVKNQKGNRQNIYLIAQKPSLYSQ